MRLLRTVFCITVLTTIVGCAGFPSQPFNRAANQNVKTIGLITPYSQEEWTVMIVNHAGNNFGIIGALIAVGNNSAKSEKVNKALAPHNYNHQAQFLREMHRSLTAAGYRVVNVPMSEPRKDAAFLAEYPQSKSVDAYFDSYIDMVGYIASGHGTPYRATYYIGAQLVAANDSKKLFAERILYNPTAVDEKVVSISADPNYAFDGSDAIVQRIEHAIEGMNVAIRTVSDEYSRLLR